MKTVKIKSAQSRLVAQRRYKKMEQEQKEYLDLSCRFARRKFYDKDKKKYTRYISGETVVDEEKIRFKLNEKDSRLFQYMLKKMGLIERDTRELKYETEEDLFDGEDEEE